MIRAERHERVTVLTIDREERRNALDLEHTVALTDAFGTAAEDGTRVVLLTGAGTSFCAGADLGGVFDPKFRDALQQLLRRMASVPVPILAAVNGPAIGAGTQLAIASDLRIAAPTARFAVPIVKLGLAYDPWSVQRLMSIAGGGPARALLIGLDSFDVQRAHAVGLVDRIGGIEDALEWAGELSGYAPLTHAFNKLATNAGAHADPEDPELNAAMWRCFESEDCKEAAQAYLERRAPEFQGR
jgi:enoyl-CoA hydratase